MWCEKIDLWGGAKLLRPTVFEDERGWFFEAWRAERYREIGIVDTFVQSNIVECSRPQVRGMHFQDKPGQAKLVTVLAGQIWDVFLGITPDSPTFGKWGRMLLSRGCQLYLPVGFAHGFAVPRAALVTYALSAPYDEYEESAIAHDDPYLRIPWSLMCDYDRAKISGRDTNAQTWSQFCERRGVPNPHRVTR